MLIGRSSIRLWVAAVLAAIAIAVALWQLSATRSGLEIRTESVGATPVTIYRAAGTETAPVVVIAHGFAGSQQLMQPLALTLAQNGYVAVTFDFLGHGQNPKPLTGDITREAGATQALLAQLEDIIAFAKALPLSQGKVALLAHSMGSDIIVRAANSDPDIAATVAISMFSNEVGADNPRNLLMIVGGWEGGLKAEALRMLGLGREGSVEEAATYGQFDQGTARRVVFADAVEHVGVLYSAETLAETVDWLNAVFMRTSEHRLAIWGPWLGLLFLGAVALAWPLSHLLPRVSERSGGSPVGWPPFLLLAVLPAIGTPLVLTFIPISFLPVLVGDYLAVHFGLYGLLTLAGLWIQGGQSAGRFNTRKIPAVLAIILVAAFSMIAIIWPIDAFVTALAPIASRLPLLGVMFVGMLPYFLGDEWLTRRYAAGRGRYLVTKLCFLLSLVIAIVLNTEQLFFLIIIFPVIVIFFIIFGLFSSWSYRATGHPLVAALANAVVFAIAIAGSFPIIEG